MRGGVIVENKTAPTITLSAGGWQDVTLNVAKTGYTAIFCTLLTTYNSDVLIVGAGMDGTNTAKATIKNVANANKNATLTFQVMYKPS